AISFANLELQGMTESGTTRMLTRRRALLCVVLAASLGAPRLSAGIPAERRGQSVQILSLTGSSPAILVNRCGPRIDQSRERTAVDSPFILLPLRGPASDRGRSARAVEEFRPQSRCAASTQSGRSPPAAIS